MLGTHMLIEHLLDETMQHVSGSVGTFGRFLCCRLLALALARLAGWRGRTAHAGQRDYWR